MTKTTLPFSPIDRPAQFILKPFFTPYVMTGAVILLVVGVPAASLYLGTWGSFFETPLSAVVTCALLFIGVLTALYGIIEIKNERVYFYDDEFVYVYGWKKQAERIRYDTIEETSYDSGWTKGEMHVTVRTKDGKMVKISNTIFNQHRFTKELNKRLLNIYKNR